MTPLDEAVGTVENHHAPTFEYGDAVQTGAAVNAAEKVCAVVVVALPVTVPTAGGVPLRVGLDRMPPEK